MEAIAAGVATAKAAPSERDQSPSQESIEHEVDEEEAEEQEIQYEQHLGVEGRPGRLRELGIQIDENERKEQRAEVGHIGGGRFHCADRQNVRQ